MRCWVPRLVPGVGRVVDVGREERVVAVGVEDVGQGSKSTALYLFHDDGPAVRTQRPTRRPSSVMRVVTLM